MTPPADDEMVKAAQPSVVYIYDGCKISETSIEVIITEPNGKEHKFPKGSYVFSQRNLVDANKW